MGMWKSSDFSRGLLGRPSEWIGCTASALAGLGLLPLWGLGSFRICNDLLNLAVKIPGALNGQEGVGWVEQ